MGWLLLLFCLDWQKRDNTLTGNAGNDTLNGNEGIDTLIGGIGDDVYIVDSTDDTITENLNEGTDTIQSSVTFSLVNISNIENLTLTGSSFISGSGNASNNVITGNSANNNLYGREGADTINGGAGNDVIYGDTTLPDTSFIFNGSLYRYSDYYPAWWQARTQAQSLCGNLVTINSQDEQYWLAHTFGSVDSSVPLWIGYTDQGSEGTFYWVSGENSTYTNWDQGEPNNSDYKDYVGMGGPEGKWNVYSDYEQTLRGIIENKIYEWNGSVYLLSGADNSLLLD